MILKILLTLTVIVVGLMFIKRQGQERLQQQNVVARPVTRPTAAQAQKQKKLNQAVYAFLAVMTLSAGVILVQDWLDNYTEVTVTVVNTQTGTRVNYEAQRIDVKSSSFTTTSGKQIFIADIERIEID